MSLAVIGLNPPLRILPDDYLSVDAFWQLIGENPDLCMERSASGELILMTPTLGGSSFRTSYINRVLGNWADGDCRGSVLDSNAGCNLLDGSVLCPDVAWISLHRWTPPPPDADTRVPCPEFVVELRSSSDRIKPLRDKMEVWIANGAELAWLIDPSRKAVEIYRPDQHPEIQEGHTAVYGEGPVSGFVLELARIWS